MSNLLIHTFELWRDLQQLFQVLYVIESRLRDILLRSHMLAAFLSRKQLTDMDEVVEALGKDKYE